MKMPTLTGHQRAEIEQNVWTVSPDAHEVICPPNGRVVEVNYENGDRFRVEFCSLQNSEEFSRRYPQMAHCKDLPEYPLTAAEIYETAAGTSVSFNPNGIAWAGAHIGGNFLRGLRGAAISIDATREEMQRLFPYRHDNE
ncbi:hypothetical protein [Streptomyces luteogriseus]|uniref:hypothetical protein n=1 Tax=Streptomyces luteogriseus TaxID=68233 RepID=UPI00371DDD64